MSGEDKRAVIDLKTQPRVAQMWSVYYAAHHDEVEAIAEEEWQTYLTNAKPGEKLDQKMHVVQRVARRLEKAAPPEEREALDTQRREPGAKFVRQAEDEEDKRKQVAEGFAMYVFTHLHVHEI